MPQTAERRKRYKNVTVEVTRAYYDELAKAAESRGQTVSDWVREALSAALRSQ